MNAIVLAGSNYKTKLIEYGGMENDALITIGDKTMVEYVVEAISGSPHIKQVVVVGPVERLEPLFRHNSKVTLAHGGDTVVQGAINGLVGVDMEEKVLLASADIPLLTTAAVNDFIDSCAGWAEKDLYYSIVPKEVNDLKFPQVKRTYVKLVEGVFTGGNILLVDPEIVKQCAPRAEELVALRKSPLRLARLIGLGFIVKYVLGRLSIGEIEKQTSKLLGVRGKAVISHYPEIGVDVDKPSDLDLVRSVLEAAN